MQRCSRVGLVLVRHEVDTGQVHACQYTGPNPEGNNSEDHAIRPHACVMGLSDVQWLG